MKFWLDRGTLGEQISKLAQRKGCRVVSQVDSGVGQPLAVNSDSPLGVSQRRQTSGHWATSLASRRCIPQKCTGALSRAPTSPRHGILWGILQTDWSCKSIESPDPRTARDKLRQTRLGEVDGIVAVNELGGIGHAPTIRERGPCIGKVSHVVYILLG